jgi:pimeloyl-ACP methyl ester carboxylesterase
MRYANGVAYTLSGSGDPALFIHCLCVNSLIWRAVVDALGPSMAVLLVDLPGHGFTERRPGCTLDDVVSAVHDVVHESGIDRPLVVGHSIGGALATLYAGRYPTRGVINVDQPLRLENVGAWVTGVKDTLNGNAFYETMETFKQLVGVDALDPDARRFLDMCWNPSPLSIADYWRCLWEQPVSATENSLTNALRSIKAPYIALHGSPPEEDYGAWLRAFNPRVQLVTWTGGHFLYLQQPERFADLVRSTAASS